MQVNRKQVKFFYTDGDMRILYKKTHTKTRDALNGLLMFILWISMSEQCMHSTETMPRTFLVENVKIISNEVLSKTYSDPSQEPRNSKNMMKYKRGSDSEHYPKEKKKLS